MVSQSESRLCEAESEHSWPRVSTACSRRCRCLIPVLSGVSNQLTRLLHCADPHAWSSIPTDLLLAELSRRDDTTSRPECGSGNKGSYDTGIHVFALFLILTLSTLGMSRPGPPALPVLCVLTGLCDSMRVPPFLPAPDHG